MPSYLVVFHANLDPNHGPVDIGDDPCFDPPPTWGICRPPTRRSVRVGTNLFFIGYVAPDQYFVKGWFEVGEKISYVEAHNRFPGRTNVIISLLPAAQPLAAVIQNRQVIWRYRERRRAFEVSGLPAVPDFLYRTLSNCQVFIQNPVDEHEIDNWKCNRIFHCRTTQFEQCIARNACENEGDILLQQYRNYVVAHAHNWLDIGPQLLTWEMVEDHFQFHIALQTPVT